MMLQYLSLFPILSTMTLLPCITNHGSSNNYIPLFTLYYAAAFSPTLTTRRYHNERISGIKSTNHRLQSPIPSQSSSKRTAIHMTTSSSFSADESETTKENDHNNKRKDDNDSNDTTPQNAMQTHGNEIILAAAKEAGATEKMISIDWKSDRIVVTVDVRADEEFVGKMDEFVVLSDLSEGEEDFDFEFEYDDDEMEFEYDDFEEDEGEEGSEDDVSYDEEGDLQDVDEHPNDENDDEPFQNTNAIDLTLLTRTINDYLSRDGEDSLGYRIAQLHEIEVTTPEFDGVLRGDVMFEAYKGFDVIVEHYEDPKKAKKKNKSKKNKGGKSGKEVVNDAGAGDENEESDTNGEDAMEKKLIVSEGKLVSRDMEKEATMVNIKGRVVKFKNELIESVKLPKAKREKGAK
mmetsp:Transcript_28279/g.58735  ORF Transcript_28279/g.58735 Transcript_28279/m.58735 type:complete len:404 (-) Transcript_28279:43-1254(-)